MGQQTSCCARSGQARFGKEDADEVTQAEDNNALDFKPGEALTLDAMMAQDTQNVLDEKDLAYLEDTAGTNIEICENPEEEIGLTKEGETIGDHVCPKLGDEATNDFMNNDRLRKILEASKEDMGKNFSLDKDSFEDMSDKPIAMAVSDPNAEDCPLVFVSPGFEALTGYTSEFVVGRSCRFLQPTSKVLNDGVNLNDRKMMRHFCNELQPEGTTILNLLLNERTTGERFWNLLRMQYVTVDDKQYIFAVQCTLDGFMPKLLTKRLLGKDKNTGIVSALGDFLNALENMRSQLRKSEFMPILELKGYYTCALNCLQLLPALSKITAASPDVSKVAGLVKDSASAKDEVLAPGCLVTINQELKYPTYKVPAKSRGKVLSIDSFGTATIDWTDIGKKGMLKRDIFKLVVVD